MAARRDSARFFFFVCAIIVTLAVICDRKVQADNNYVTTARESSGESLPPPDSARQDDYDDYFEDPDDSTAVVLNDDGRAQDWGSARSQKLSWSPTTSATADKEINLEPTPDQTSLVIVFDGTTTMYEDMQRLRQEAQAIIHELNGRAKNPIFNYIFVSIRNTSESPVQI